MTTKTPQVLDTKGLLSDGFVDALLDLIELPEDGVVSAIIVANNGGREMRAHFAPLTKAQLSAEKQWWDCADVWADVYGVPADDITEAVKRRWPEVRVFVVPGCLCCNGTDDLREYDRER